MSAPLSGPLFHGSIHPFKKGEIIKPQNQEEAFATPDAHYAGRYAEAGNMRADRNSEDKRLNVKDNPALFGTVYNVELVKSEDIRHDTSSDVHEKPIVASKAGFKVTGISHLTSEALYSPLHRHTYEYEEISPGPIFKKPYCSECKEKFY